MIIVFKINGKIMNVIVTTTVININVSLQEYESITMYDCRQKEGISAILSTKIFKQIYFPVSDYVLNLVSRRF